MPGTTQETIEAARQLARFVLAPDQITAICWADGTRITPEEEREVFALAMYELIWLKKYNFEGQRRALALLRTLLSASQRRQLAAGHGFLARGNLGGVYRLHANVGVAWKVEKHGIRWFATRSFCIHDMPEICPPADVTIGHLLLLSADEAEFLRTANAKDRPLLCWDGEYLKRARRKRLERACLQIYGRTGQ